MGSPSLHARPMQGYSNSNNYRITGPQPVDHEKQYQLQLEREQHYRLMIEKEQRHVDLLRSQIAHSPDEKKCAELAKTEKNLQTLQAMLQNHIRSQNEQSPSTPNTDTPPPLPSNPPPTRIPKKSKLSAHDKGGISPNSNTCDVPPPLPKRNRTSESQNKKSPMYINGKVLVNNVSEEINHNTKIEPRTERDNTDNSNPPPLPPRTPQSLPPGSSGPDAVNSINKQMSYPLVATCATLVDNYSPNHTHHRTKSSPESLSILSPAEASKRLIASESMSDLSRQEGWENMATPPGTPPPPYPSPLPNRKDLFSNRSSGNIDFGDLPFEECAMETSSAEVSPLRGAGSIPAALSRVVADSSPIHAATPQMAQQPIISMEDDEISDQEVGQLEDHGPFKSLSRLMEFTPHLAVFTNYVLSNCDPNSLLFYLITELYKEGNAKEMRKWAFEIHSSFLVPGAPMRLCNVDENIAREIDDVLTREYDREEILRKIFWKARNRAKEELTKQLVEFQQKRTAGLGTMYGPNDSVLEDSCYDKVKEMKVYESLFQDKLEPYVDELDKENYDPKRYYTAAALTTVITRVFGVRPTAHALDRFPTFVNKEKSFRKFIGRYSRKLNVQGHQFVAQIYYTVVVCNNCHQIIYGIGPQGYQCSVCLINLHRLCVKLYDDVCPGPISKKDRGIGKFIRIRHETNEHRRKHSAHFIQMEKEKRQAEEKDSGVEAAEAAETKPGHPVSRSSSDRRPDAVREEASKNQDIQDHTNDKHEEEATNTESTASLPASTGGNKRRTASNINRSESVKEQSEKEKRKQRRNISDPLHNTTNDHIDLDSQGLGTNSGSSSNSSLSSNSRFSECLSNNSSDAALGSHTAGSEWDSDMEVEVDPPDWQRLVPPEDLATLHPYEKKRQDVINEFFHTEKSHVRNLKVLDLVFMKPLTSKQCLKPEELNLVFPNLNEVLELHVRFNNTMKSKRKENPVIRDLGDVLLGMFDGSVGETFQRAAATFCERQQLALELIKEKRKKDSRFESILSDCEKNNLCRRLPLQGIISTQMQRLSKYPLFLERLMDTVEKSIELDAEYWQSELVKLRQAHDRCKEILNHVNEAAKLAYNRARLEEIQRHLDATSEFKNFNLTKENLIHEGDMTLQRPNKGPLQIYTLLTEEAVVFLQKEGDRYLLKPIQTGAPGQKPFTPIISMNLLLFRKKAGMNSTLYIISTNPQHIQMFVLQVRDPAEREVWLKHLSDATEAYREGKSKTSDSAHETEEETVQDLPTSSREPTERAESVGGSEVATSEEGEAAAANAEENSQSNIDLVEEDGDKRLSQSESDTCQSTEIGGGVAQTKMTPDDWPLIQPSEVQVVVQPVLAAESRVTSLEQIRRKDEVVRQALADKEGLVADLLSIPREDFHHIADMASEEVHSDISSERDSTEFVLAPMYQVNQLLEAVNESLNISEVEPILATGGTHPSCASNENHVCNKNEHIPSVPAHKLRDIVTVLNSQLTTLLSVVKQGDAERDRLRKELHKLREQFHEKSFLHGYQNVEVDSVTTLDSLQSGDLESIEESPTENES